MTRSTFAAIPLLVRRSLRQHALANIVTIISVALASGLLYAVFAIQGQAYDAFTGGTLGFDAVLGARGSQLQLVLNTVFHLETSPGNLPWEMYESIRKDPRVELAIPYALGDNYHGFRIVGTSPELFSDFEYKNGEHFRVQPSGHFFDPTNREAVIGSFVAAQTGLREGDTFSPYHGLAFSEALRHKEEYSVVGVLEPTNSPSDRVLFIPLEGFYRMGGHVLRGSGTEYHPESGVAIPEEDKELSAVMLKLRSPQGGFSLDREINRQGKVATLAWPIGRVMVELFQKIGWAYRILTLVAYLIVVVAASSIMASVYNTIQERRRDFAILRALGAHRIVVFTVVLMESATIAALGAVLGFVFHAAILYVAAAVLRAQTGVVLDVFKFHPVFVFGPIGMTLLGTLAGLIPAMRAYSTEVAANLAPQS